MTDSFIEWCGWNNLQHTVVKTKGIVVNFGRKKTMLIPWLHPGRGSGGDKDLQISECTSGQRSRLDM